MVRRPAPGRSGAPRRPRQPYASDGERRALERAGAVADMRRKGDCRDAAVSENSFATLKTQALVDRVPNDHDAASRAIRRSIDGDDNPRRRDPSVAEQSPIQFESNSRTRGDGSMVNLSLRQGEVHRGPKRPARTCGRRPPRSSDARARPAIA